MINWDVNAGTIITVAVGFGGTLWKLHARDIAISILAATQHAENKAKLGSLEASHVDIKRDIHALGETQKECQKKITETREMVIRLDEANKQRPNPSKS